MTIESKDTGCITTVPSSLRALGAAIGKDDRPKDCRNRRRDEGHPYPKSGCHQCGNGGLMGCPHERITASNDNLPPIVAFTGQAGSGKSTATRYLVEKHGYTLVKFAGPLKDMLRAVGMAEDEIEGSYKETPFAYLCDKSPRYAMQTLGTEWGRKCMGEDFWVNLWKDSADRIVQHGGRVVVDDCRFPNEAQAVRRLGGDIYRLVGRGGIPGQHESERGCGDEDTVIANDNTPDALFGKVEEALKRYG